jgi:hypothetical protein
MFERVAKTVKTGRMRTWRLEWQQWTRRQRQRRRQGGLPRSLLRVGQCWQRWPQLWLLFQLCGTSVRRSFLSNRLAHRGLIACIYQAELLLLLRLVQGARFSSPMEGHRHEHRPHKDRRQGKKLSGNENCRTGRNPSSNSRGYSRAKRSRVLRNARSTHSGTRKKTSETQ